MNGMGFPFVDTSSGGNVTNLVKSLDHLIKVTNSETKVIPGHGPVATQADLINWRNMIASALEQVSQRKTSGESLETLLANNPLKPMEKPNAFISADAFATAIWQSLEAG